MTKQNKDLRKEVDEKKKDIITLQEALEESDSKMRREVGERDRKIALLRGEMVNEI